ncbi:MAG TPA: hypothetical protein VE077_21390 [Candidatus Methylomirabilis sp.]|nr:hypothetical protein [Candidatus Methylomirabilis sp.]
MNHDEALRLQAAEKYLLNEFTPPQRDEYEEHYFDCHECAEDLKATAVFLESARQLFREGVLSPQVAPQHSAFPAPVPASRGIFAWLRPAFAIPAFAALLIFIGYQNGVTIPRLKNTQSAALAPEIQKYVSLPAFESRGEGAPSLTVKVNPHQGFVLEGDMPGNSDSGYVCQIQDQSGRVLYALPVSPQQAKDTVQIRIPGGVLAPGSYKLVIQKGQGTSGSAVSANDSSSVRFAVEFLP